MLDATPGLVAILRDFLEADRLMRALYARYRRGELRFSELEELVSDDEQSVLYRLKERCHALFRPSPRNERVVMHREALFDLAVGSLFHEVTKFRESFYQQQIYAPQVAALRSQSGPEAKGLFQEFERILAAGGKRLEEGLHECEALLDQTREQLQLMLQEHQDDGAVARFLLENRAQVEEVFGTELDALLASLHGEVAGGYAVAAHSYLQSGYYEDSERAFGEAISHGGDAARYAPLRDFARGMRAFLSSDCEGVLRYLGRWAAAGGPGGAPLRTQAQAVASRLERLAVAPERERVASGASALQVRLASLPPVEGQSGGPGA